MIKQVLIKGKYLLVAIGICTFILGGTFAYFTYWQKLSNSFTVGENTVTVVEDYKPPKEMEVGDNIYKKKVSIKNTGTIPCFVRVSVEFSYSDAEKNSKITSDGVNFYHIEEYRNHLPEEWIYIDDSDELLGRYYYFTEPLEAGKETPLLFDSVLTHFETAGDIVDYDLIIYAESTQVVDKDGKEFTGTDAYKNAWQEFLERR